MSPRRLHLRFSIVDVFTQEPLEGNPLAVVEEAQGLDETTMRRIAREFNQSETTFLLPPTRPGADWRLRSFTPAGAEVFGAGHNALGAWWWLAEAGRVKLDAPRTILMQELGDRVLPVEVASADGRVVAITMTQASATFGATLDDRSAVAAALDLARADLATDRFPAQVVSTGAAHLLVPLRSRAAVDRARPDAERLAALLRAVGGQGCYLFSLDPLDPAATAHARFFNPTVGISEDPATGSAAGPLACYLVSRGVCEDGAAIVIEQGHAMGRPGRIEVRVQGHEVRITGRAVVVGEGTLRL
ncbi:MAG TPA: PhzF family phenazine biosynthesis protein [Vicinamibacterales bacterium]|nr:PhzF family phenazine biosynthesis protein [Vicinamibacterales bacterium]